MTEGLEITGLDYLVLMRNDQGHVRGNLDEKKIQHFTKTRKSSIFFFFWVKKKKRTLNKKWWYLLQRCVMCECFQCRHELKMMMF